MRYDRSFHPPRRLAPQPVEPPEGARREAGTRPPTRFGPFDLPGPGYRGPGEAGRYGNAPVAYGPDHTYDFHLGDRYGTGPDYWAGEHRVRRPASRRRSGRPRRRP